MHGGKLWRGTSRTRHRERCPDCPWEPYGFSYTYREKQECVDLEKQEALEQGKGDVQSSGFITLTKRANVRFRKGEGCAVPQRGKAVEAEDGGKLCARVMMVVPGLAAAIRTHTIHDLAVSMASLE
eukprot:66959-Prymnesium_polylepis.1